MKLKEVVHETQPWKDLFLLTTDALDAGKEAHDSGLYVAGLRLTHIIEELGSLEVETRGYKKYNTLVNILRERLNGADIAQYLMEVDDIINEEEKEWEDIWRGFA